MCVKLAQGICISEDCNFVVAVLAAVLTRFMCFFFFFKLKESSEVKFCEILTVRSESQRLLSVDFCTGPIFEDCTVYSDSTRTISKYSTSE